MEKPAIKQELMAIIYMIQSFLLKHVARLRCHVSLITTHTVAGFLASLFTRQCSDIATCLRCGGMYYYLFMIHLLLSCWWKNFENRSGKHSRAISVMTYVASLQSPHAMTSFKVFPARTVNVYLVNGNNRVTWHLWTGNVPPLPPTTLTFFTATS